MELPLDEKKMSQQSNYFNFWFGLRLLNHNSKTPRHHSYLYATSYSSLINCQIHFEDSPASWLHEITLHHSSEVRNLKLIVDNVILIFYPEGTEEEFKGSRIQLAMWVGAISYVTLWCSLDSCKWHSRVCCCTGLWAMWC